MYNRGSNSVPFELAPFPRTAILSMNDRKFFLLLCIMLAGLPAGGVSAHQALTLLAAPDLGTLEVTPGLVGILGLLLGLTGVAAGAWGGVRWQQRRSRQSRSELEHEVELHTREAESQKKILQHLNATLRASNERLQELSEQKSHLLSIAAHDLKTPIINIYSLADLLLEEQDDEPPNYEFVELIRHTARGMSTLIENVLTSAATEMGHVTLHCVQTDAVDLAERALGQCIGMAERKGQRVSFSTQGDGFDVVGDEPRLVEAMTNLISNAIKYSPLGGQISVAVERTADWVCFSVSDSGPGLSEDDHGKLFQPFQRLSAQPTNGESSSGMGLYIVRQYVEMHGGAVGAESFPGMGSTFRFCLPVATDAALEPLSPVSIPLDVVPADPV